MIKREVNTELLIRTIEAFGENAIAQASVKSGVSVSTIQQLMAASYPSRPQEETRYKLCKALGLSENDLFPLIREGEERTA